MFRFIFWRCIFECLSITAIFSALSYMCLYLLKMPMMEELWDSLRLIDFGVYLMTEGGWFEEVCM